jgi:hypothetical protein
MTTRNDDPEDNPDDSQDAYASWQPKWKHQMLTKVTIQITTLDDKPEDSSDTNPDDRWYCQMAIQMTTQYQPQMTAIQMAVLSADLSSGMFRLRRRVPIICIYWTIFKKSFSSYRVNTCTVNCGTLIC